MKTIAYFSPAMQKDAGKNKMDCFFVQCPTLKQLNNTYGNEIAEIWLTTQLSDLNDYAMVKEEMNTTHYDMLPDQIVDKYGFLKLTEILLFFYEIKSGTYGPLFNKLSPMRIMEFLERFVGETRKNAYILREEEAKRMYNEYRKQNEESHPERFEKLIKRISISHSHSNIHKSESKEEFIVMQGAMNFIHNTSLSSDVKKQMTTAFVNKYGCTPEEYIYNQKKNKKE